MKPNGLRFQLMWWLFGVGVIPGLIAGVVLFVGARGDVVEDAGRRMERDLTTVVSRMDRLVDSGEANLVWIAEELARRAGLENDSKGSLWAEAVINEGISRASSVIDHVGFLGPDGETLATGDTETTLALGVRDVVVTDLQARTGTWDGVTVFHGALSASPDLPRYLSFARPVLDAEGTSLGMVYALISPVELRAVFDGLVDPGTGWLIHDGAGQVIMGDGVGRTGMTSVTPIRDVDRAVVDSEPILLKSRAFTRPGDVAAWQVVVTIPEGAVMDGIRPLRYSLAGGAVLLVVALVSVLVSRRLASPIRDLEEGTRRIEQGESDVELPVGNRNELERWVGTVHRMASDLRRTRERALKAERLAGISEACLDAMREISERLGAMEREVLTICNRNETFESVQDAGIRVKEHVQAMQQVVASVDHVFERAGSETTPGLIASAGSDTVNGTSVQEAV